MRVAPLSEVEPRPRRVAIGEFDGVHVGHREVIAGNDTVLTFEPHPALVLRPGQAPKLLTSLDVKIDLIAELGIEELIVVPFDLAFAHQEPLAFIDDVLVGALGAGQVSVGENFHFGHCGRGNADLLRADSRFVTRVVPLFRAGGRAVSSSQIRQLIAEGEVEEASQLLGGPFRMRGNVVPGDRRGRELGFPTANIIPDAALACPGHGVYACRVGEWLASVNVGVRPTFGNDLQLLVESFILDFDGDLYGEQLTIEFVTRLRGELRFDTAEELVLQMHRDVERTRELLASGVE